MMIDHAGDHADDPGSEQLDLLDALAMTDTEAKSRSYLDAPAHVVTPDLARLTGHATDYEWATWLRDALVAGLVPVIEHAGWKTNGRPRSAGPFTPRGLIVHHDASPKGPSPAAGEFIFRTGRPAEGIPAPLAQLWLCMGCDAHEPGTWHIGAAGRANHAGTGTGWGAIGPDRGNTLAIGIEIDHTPGEPIPLSVYKSLVRGCAALLAHMHSDPREWLAGHREYAPGRKIDPTELDLPGLRRDVLELMVSRGKRPTSYPGAEHFTIGHQCTHGHVRQLEKWLLALAPKSRHRESDTFTRWTAGQVEKFQAERRALSTTTTPGQVDRRTWRKIEQAARVAQ